MTCKRGGGVRVDKRSSVPRARVPLAYFIRGLGKGIVHFAADEVGHGDLASNASVDAGHLVTEELLIGCELGCGSHVSFPSGRALPARPIRVCAPSQANRVETGSAGRRFFGLGR